MVDLNIELPEGFLDEEVRWEHTISGKMKEVWAVELDLLNELLRVCKKYDIKIFANGGTMLGAVRHKGFIPWDDDIDMMMFREDYEKLCKVAVDEFKEPYFFQTEYTDPGSLRGHAQLRNSNTTAILNAEMNPVNGKPYFQFNQGIFIDIFPLDNVVEDCNKLDEQIKRVKVYKRYAFKFANISSRYQKDMSHGVKGAIKAICHFMGDKLAKKLQRKFYLKFEKECQAYNDQKTERVAIFTLKSDNASRDKYREDAKELIMMPFEFMEIPVNRNFEHALANDYGDYNKIVKGGSLHGDVLFDTDNSYTQYLK